MKNTKYNKNKIKKLFFGRSFGRLLCCSLGSSRSSSFKGDCPAVGQVQTPQMLLCPTGYSTTGLVVSAVEELNEKLTLLIDVLNRLPGGLVEGLGQALGEMSLLERDSPLDEYKDIVNHFIRSRPNKILTTTIIRMVEVFVLGWIYGEIQTEALSALDGPHDGLESGASALVRNVQAGVEVELSQYVVESLTAKFLYHRAWKRNLAWNRLWLGDWHCWQLDYLAGALELAHTLSRCESYVGHCRCRSFGGGGTDQPSNPGMGEIGCCCGRTLFRQSRVEQLCRI